MTKINLALIFGGQSGEYEVSLKSAQSIFDNLDKDKYNIFSIALSKNGNWYGPIDGTDIASFEPSNYTGSEITLLPKPGRQIYSLNDFKSIFTIDVAFPITHGTFGEDGTLQGLLEYSKIPYVGSGVCGSAVGMDKIIMKDIFKANEIPQVNYIGVESSEIKEDLQDIIERVTDQLNYPVFVKPANLGSSVGISKVKNHPELISALLFASKYDRRVIIEEGINIREIEVSALGNSDVKISAFGEILPNNEFYDYNAKYVDNNSITKIAEHLSKKQREDIINFAKKAFKSLDLAGLARIDFFINKEDEEVLINEVNTLPGFTDISMYPKLWEESGIKINDLLDQLVELAFKRGKEKEVLNRDY